jgi:hypothetical protein
MDKNSEDIEEEEEVEYTNTVRRMSGSVSGSLSERPVGTTYIVRW